MKKDLLVMTSTFLFNQFLSINFYIDRDGGLEREIFAAWTMVVAVQWFTLFTMAMYMKVDSIESINYFVNACFLSTFVCLNYGVFFNTIRTELVKRVSYGIVTLSQFYGVYVIYKKRGEPRNIEHASEPNPVVGIQT